uniref:Uncharacterized protein n=1 Tax=Schizaphis graminum TaxID=13262 RepID=A0A2S2NQY6_SCHGA
MYIIYIPSGFVVVVFFSSSIAGFSTSREIINFTITFIIIIVIIIYYTLVLSVLYGKVSKPREVPARNNRSNGTGRPVLLRRNQWETRHNNRWHIDRIILYTRDEIFYCRLRPLSRSRENASGHADVIADPKRPSL